jgi:hypothetical protein
VGERKPKRLVLIDYPQHTGVPSMSNTARNAVALLKEQKAPMNEERLYYKKLVTKRDLQSLRKRLSYFGRRTVNNEGVSGPFMKRLRKDVLIYLGGESFKYLESKIDGRNYMWNLSSTYSWEEIERLGMTRGYTRKSK